MTTGGRINYSPANGYMTYDSPGTSTGYFGVFAMKPSGTGQICLSCTTLLPQMQNGDPVWDATGNYILFQAEDPSLKILPPKFVPIAYLYTNPGYGANNNLWIMNAGGAQVWQLTHVTSGLGVIHPQWSHSGKQIVWAEKVGLTGKDQQWTIKLADLTWTNGTPSLTNVQLIQPFGTDYFYETSAFSADDSQILFTGGHQTLDNLNIYLYTLRTGAMLNLTNPNNAAAVEWNELAQYTPSGKVVWSSSRNITVTRNYYVPFSDYWIMNGDGSDPQRLSYFNTPGYPEYYPNGLFAGDFTIGPTSQFIYGGLEENQVPPPNSSMIYYITRIVLTAPL